MIETITNNNSNNNNSEFMAITQEPKLIIHSNVNNILDTDSCEQQRQNNIEITPKNSVCSNLCKNLFSIFKKDEKKIADKNMNSSSAILTTEKIINKIFLENSISSSNTSCDSIDLSFFHRQSQILEESKNKRKILPEYKNSYGSLSGTSISNENETYRTNFTASDYINDKNKNEFDNKSKDTIDEVIKNLNINLSQISTNFDSLSMDLKMSENTSASQSDVSLDLQSRKSVE